MTTKADTSIGQECQRCEGVGTAVVSGVVGANLEAFRAAQRAMGRNLCGRNRLDELLPSRALRSQRTSRTPVSRSGEKRNRYN